MNQEILNKEVDEYNELVKKIQENTQTGQQFEQERLIRFGRIQMLNEQISKEKGDTLQEAPSFEKKSKSKEKAQPA